VDRAKKKSFQLVSYGQIVTISPDSPGEGHDLICAERLKVNIHAANWNFKTKLKLCDMLCV